MTRIGRLWFIGGPKDGEIFPASLEDDSIFPLTRECHTGEGAVLYELAYSRYGEYGYPDTFGVYKAR